MVPQRSVLPLIVVAFGLAPGCLTDTGKPMCHLFRRTESEPVVTSWDVNADLCVGQRILEEVDDLGRVTELRFLDGNSLYRSTVFNPAVIQFAYGDNIIRTTLFYADGSLFGDTYAPFRAEYRTDGQRLVSCRFEFSPRDSTRYGHDVEAGEGRCLYVPDYRYSMALRAGVDPVAPGFDPASVGVPSAPRPFQRQ